MEAHDEPQVACPYPPTLHPSSPKDMPISTTTTPISLNSHAFIHLGKCMYPLQYPLTFSEYLDGNILPWPRMRSMHSHLYVHVRGTSFIKCITICCCVDAAYLTWIILFGGTNHHRYRYTPNILAVFIDWCETFVREWKDPILTYIVRICSSILGAPPITVLMCPHCVVCTAFTSYSCYFADTQTQPLRVMERSVYSARWCFIENLRKSTPPLLDDMESAVYIRTYDWLMQQKKPHVDLIVYLRTSPEVPISWG